MGKFNADIMDAFELLGIARPEEASRKQVKSAYAKRLKKIDPAEDPQGFQALRGALETALAVVEERSGHNKVPVQDRPAPTGHDGLDGGTELPDLPDLQESPALSVSAADLSLAEIRCLRVGGNTVSTLTRILNDDTFEDLELNKQLERELVLFLDRRLVMRAGGVPAFTDDVTRGLVKAMAARFDWLSDYRGIEMNADRPEMVSMAISFLIGAEDTRQEYEREAMALWDKIIGIAVFFGIPLGVLAQFLEKDSIWQMLAGGAAGLSFLVIMFMLMRR